MKTAAQVDAALLPELERVGKAAPGSVTMEQVAGALKKIGVNHVVHADSAAQCAAAAAEALLDQRLSEGKPLILTNDPAAKKFLQQEFAALSDRFAFYPSELAIFGEAAREQFGADKAFAFTPVGTSAAEAAELDTVDIAVNSRELWRIMVRTGAEPHVRRTAALETVSGPRPSGKYGRLLERAEWSMDADYEAFTLSADGKELRCALCRNLGQARSAISRADAFDVIRVLA